MRFLTEYGQYPAPVNNHELFYHFQGFTSDGEYYIVATLPVTAPVLAETGDAGSPLPSGGILYPFFGILLSPMFASAAMSLSSVSVIGNALRLRRVKL